LQGGQGFQWVKVGGRGYKEVQGIHGIQKGTGEQGNRGTREQGNKRLVWAIHLLALRAFIEGFCGVAGGESLVRLWCVSGGWQDAGKILPVDYNTWAGGGVAWSERASVLWRVVLCKFSAGLDFAIPRSRVGVGFGI